MSWVNTLSAWQWLLMAAVPPLIVMLYFLKLRRVPVQVPSTFLWQRAIEDLHVNSIWQRLRKNLLLLLQLLAVLVLILACLRPGVRGEIAVGNRSIIMIDNSASMLATDVGPSRLAEAKKQALELIDSLTSADVAMVIAFSDLADVRQGYTADKSKLRKAIESIAATDRLTDLNEALRAASGLANPGRTSQIEDVNDVQVAEAVPAELFIFSDGGFAAPQLDLGNLKARYLPIGETDPQNVGILAFTVERNAEKESQVEAFARLQNFGSQVAEFQVTLSMDGQLIDATDVSIGPAEASGVSFQVANVTEGKLKLELEFSDDFAQDNVAFAGLDPPRQLDVVLVTEGNSALEAALATSQAAALAQVRILSPADLTSPENESQAQSGSIDLFIYDQCTPEQMPESNTLFVGTLPPGDRWKANEPSGPLFVIDTNRAHPMLQYVDMGTVRIVEGRSLELPTAGTELLRTDAGILMGVAPREAYQDAVVGMPLFNRKDGVLLANTDWPIKPSFPVFVLNALEFLGGTASNAGSVTVKPGQPVSLHISNRYSRFDIESPGGAQVTVDRREQPRTIFTHTDELGFYEVRPSESERMLQLFTVNLFSELESNILPRAELTIGAQEVVATNDQRDIARVEYWRWLLALALVILSVEWFLYNRRIAI
ncbi:MAG: BatA and WFA domain-containing protein [Planctomycetales bacterium]|nr:BatA and WFA domain-containing protein [Planctomycetales bacterium]